MSLGEFTMGFRIVASLISLFAFAVPLHAQDSPDNRSLVLEAQDLLYAMGYPVGKPDGKFGGKTAAALKEETGIDLKEVNSDTLKPLYESFVSDVVQKSTKVDWNFRAAEFSISGGNNPNVFVGLSTLDNLANTGFNVVTFDFHCDRGYAIDKTATADSPLERQFGCDLGYAFYNDSSKDALQIYIDEARKRNLQINLKPTFLDITSSGQRYGYKFGEVPVNEFLYGDMPKWDGYVPRILRIAEFAEKNKIEFITIGTEFGNLNRNLMLSKDWVEIIAKVRSVYHGKLIYAHNLGPDNSLADFEKLVDFAKNVDFMAVNFFPNLILDGRKYYTSDEVQHGLTDAELEGKNLITARSDFSQKTGSKLIMSEVSFFTWRGSFNWMFRNTCDFDNAGKKDWIFTKGPLAVKEPSVAASLVLASGWMDAFSKLPFVYGASHTFWYQTWVDLNPDDAFVLSSGVKECGKVIANNDYLKTILRHYYLGSDG